MLTMNIPLLKSYIDIYKKKENMGLTLGPLLFVVIILIPTPQSMVEVNLEKPISHLSPQIALGAMIWMVIWWITECVPLGFTSLLAPFIFITSGILPVNEALPKFADPIIWIFISGFILAAAFQKCGLDERIAYRLATFYRGNNPKIATFFIASLPVFILSMTGSITASTTIVFPFVGAFMKILNIPIGATNRNDGNVQKTLGNNDVNDNSHQRNVGSKDKKSKYAEASFLSLGQAATAGAMLLLISTAPNLIAKSTVEDFVPDETISFTDWFIIGTPHAIIGLLISWSIIFVIIKPEVKSLSASYERFRTNLKRMGKITTEEKVVLCILFAALILWIVPSLLRSFYPDTIVTGDSNETTDIVSALFYNLTKNVSESVPALLIILAIGLIKLRKSKIEGEKITNTTTSPLLSWNEMLKAIDWNIVFLFGGGLVLGLGIESSGLALWIGNQISDSVGANFTASSIFAISAILGFILSYAASNTASAVIACPIAASLAIGAGFNPIPPIIAAGLGASISSAIPSTTPPMAIIYSSRAVSILNMFKTGMISDLLRLAILIFIGPMLIDLVF
jgi:solute carrier family 13 (sodium-dependent dicarboxylate transporter), member 2/3/5